MSQFIIKISDINKCLSAFQDIDMQMKDQIESLSKVKQSISAVKGFEYFLEQISVIEKQMHSERKGVIGLKKALGDIVAEYINTEEAILNKGTVEIDIEKSYAKAGENAGCLSHIFSRYFKLIKELSDNNPTINANEEFVAYLQSEYGFDQKTSEYMLDLYNRIKANNPKDTHEEIDWKFSRAISQMGGYNNKPVSFGPFSIETDAWKKGAGIVYGYKDEKKYFCDTLGMDEAEYKYLRQMVRLQHFMTSDADIYGADAVKKMYNNGSPTDEFNSWKETYNNATG